MELGKIFCMILGKKHKKRNLGWDTHLIVMSGSYWSFQLHQKLLFQQCLYYYNHLPFMSKQTNAVPQSVCESGDVLDEECVLSMKHMYSHSPISNASSSAFDNNLEVTQHLDFTNLSSGPDIDSTSQA
ncbi:hypothetical protein DFH28DRAFT_349704 [Melampsora americana]|nr:hypothetical protein DFH28DRAFT_349704 [Melampsora americana]